MGRLRNLRCRSELACLGGYPYPLRAMRLIPPIHCLLALVLAVCLTTGCRSVEKRIAPSNHRDWAPDQAVLPTAEFNGNLLNVQNIRYCKHLAPGEYVTDYYDKTYDLSRLRGVDFIVVPFGPVPAVAHTMLSFEFDGPPGPTPSEPIHLAVSVEVRKEKGETFNPFLSMTKQYEIMYVVADERDALYKRAVINDSPTYLYRTIATPEAARTMLVDMLTRANKLADDPEFYDLLLNNCTTNIAQHVNRIKPNRIVYDIGVLLPGLSDQKAHAEGLIAGAGTFEQLKSRALINTRARLATSRDDFSAAIRR